MTGIQNNLVFHVVGYLAFVSHTQAEGLREEVGVCESQLETFYIRNSYVTLSFICAHVIRARHG